VLSLLQEVPGLRLEVLVVLLGHLVDVFVQEGIRQLGALVSVRDLSKRNSGSLGFTKMKPLANRFSDVQVEGFAHVE